MLKLLQKELVRIRRVIIGMLPYVKMTNLNRDTNSATNISSDTLTLTDGPIKSRREVVAKRSVALLKESIQLKCVPRHRATEEVYPSGERNIGIQSRRHILQGHMAPQKFGKEGLHRKELFRSVNLKNTIGVRHFFEDGTQQETLQQEGEKHGI